MRRMKLFALVVLLFAPSSFGQISPRATTEKSTTANPGYSITVVPPTDPIRLGSRISITVTVKNISDKDIYWDSRLSDTAYQAFQISLTKNSRKVETTVFHRRIRSEQRPDDPQEVERGDSILFPVPPGKSLNFTIDLGRLYEITEPGLYTLDVWRIGDDNVTIVRAKTLTLKIAP